MFESKYSKVLTIILIVVIAAILILLAVLAIDYARKYATTKDASQAVEEFEADKNITNNNDIANEVDENITLEGLEETPTATETADGSATKKTYKGFTMVGTMRIPEINLEYPLLEEVSTKSLETALVVLYPSADNINMPGNTVVIGHNYRNGLFFSNLKKLGNGAKIYVTDYRGTTVTYEVYNKFEASSTDTSFYSRDTNGEIELTLSTCTDASNDQRTIIFARGI